MDSAAAHIPDWQETQSRLANRSAEDVLFDTVGGAVAQYVKAKATEAEQWKNAYYKEKDEKEYLIALLKQNGIPVPDFNKGIPPFVVKTNNKAKKEKTFVALLQTDDVDGTLKKLHSKIDGHGGKDVAMVLLRAKSDTIISRYPTEKEFNSEFPKTTGAWRSISHYLNPNIPVDYSSVTI